MINIYGKDVERLLSAINTVITSGRSAANTMANAGMYQIQTRIDITDDQLLSTVTSSGAHGHGSGDHGHPPGSVILGKHRHWEYEIPADTASPNSDAFLKEVGNIRAIEGKLYKPKGQVLNGLGSPYSEIYELESRLGECEASPLDYIGPKHTLSEKILTAVTAAIDAKYAVITYHNALQDGYDGVHNKGKKSVPQEDFERGTTTGEID